MYPSSWMGWVLNLAIVASITFALHEKNVDPAVYISVLLAVAYTRGAANVAAAASTGTSLRPPPMASSGGPANANLNAGPPSFRERFQSFMSFAGPALVIILTGLAALAIRREMPAAWWWPIAIVAGVVVLAVADTIGRRYLARFFVRFDYRVEPPTRTPPGRMP